MDHATITDINGHMRIWPATGIEEQQIAGLQGILRDDPSGTLQFGSRARQRHAESRLKHVTDEPAAIEAMFRVIAAETIGGAQEGQCAQHDFDTRLGTVDNRTDGGKWWCCVPQGLSGPPSKRPKERSTDAQTADH